MSLFIQSLEPRLLFAATKAVLTTDLLHINTDAATVRADLRAAQKLAASDVKTITADLKGSTNKTTNAADLKQLRTDEAKLFAALKNDEASLLNATTGIARRGVAHGNAAINKPTSANKAKVSADVTALQSATAGPISKITTDGNPSAINADLAKIASDNSTNTALQTHVTNAQTNLAGALTTFGTAATKFQTDVNTLASDLATLTA